jgi:two-component system NarL family response regulator
MEEANQVASPIRLMVVDDHLIWREGVTAIINRRPDMRVVAEAGDGRQAVELFKQHNPDVTLVDLRLPLMNGIEAIVAIRKTYPAARFIVLTTYDGDEDIYQALQAGAQAYLLKDVFRDDLIEAIRAVYAGKRRIPPAVACKLAERVGNPDLTSREMEVLELIARGKSNREIGALLNITEGTVKGHVKNVLSKLGASGRTEAATSALQRGIVHLD